MSNPYAPSAAHDPAPATAGAYLPNRLRARVVMVGLAASAALDGLAILGFALSSAFSADTSAGLAVAVLLLFVGLGQVGVYALTVISWLMWQYRAATNLQALGAEHVEHTPGWSIGWWFVPFANLVKPMQAVSEIWTISASASRKSEGDGPGLLLGAWWAAWIISNFAANIAFRVFGLEESAAANMAWMAADAASLLSGVLALLVIRSIDEAQAAAAAERGFAP